MAKFLIAYNSPVTAEERMSKSTPEQMKAGMEAWLTWKDQVSNKVKFDFGMPLQAVARVDKEGVGDSSSQIGGYSFIESDSKETVLEVLKSHPHLREQGDTIDVFELLSMPGVES